MPRTNRSNITIEARKSVEATEDLDRDIKILNSDTMLKFMQNLDYDEFCQCFEYIFLLRQINGPEGFLKSVKQYKQRLFDCWTEIRKSQMLKIFQGREKGFISYWLTRSMHDKIRKFDVNQMAMFFTCFDRSTTFRNDILQAEKHKLYGMTASKNIEDWLNEV